MKAYQLVDWQQPPQLRDVPVPEPGPGQVLIKVGGACACHTDLRMMDWPAGTHAYDLPFTLGHENAGWIEALGAGVEGWYAGEPVIVFGPWGCGICPACRQGRDTLCESAMVEDVPVGGFGLDGGMAEYMLVPNARFLVPLGDLDPRTAAPLSDAALTPYHAVRNVASLLTPGAWAVVMGVGGLGHMAVQLLGAVSAARVIAVDVDVEKLALARECGADETLLGDVSATAGIRELTGGLGAAVVLDCVGSDASLALSAAVVRPGGSIQAIGLAGGRLSVGYGALPFDVTVTMPYWGSIGELSEVVELARAGRIAPRTESFPLERADEAYARLRAGAVLGRAVVIPRG